LTFTVTDSDNSAEAQFLTAFDDFGNTSYLNDFFFPLRLLALTWFVATTWAAATITSTTATTFAGWSISWYRRQIIRWSYLILIICHFCVLYSG
jgi:hypothetical protein